GAAQPCAACSGIAGARWRRETPRPGRWMGAPPPPGAPALCSTTSTPATPIRSRPSLRSRTARSGCSWPRASARRGSSTISRCEQSRCCDSAALPLSRSHAARLLLHFQWVLGVVELGEFRVPQLAVDLLDLANVDGLHDVTGLRIDRH